MGEGPGESHVCVHVWGLNRLIQPTLTGMMLRKCIRIKNRPVYYHLLRAMISINVTPALSPHSLAELAVNVHRDALAPVA